MSAGRVAPKTRLVDLLAQVNVTPEQFKYVGLSHYHFDHVGQVNAFRKATLLIGKGDWDILSGPKLPPSVRRPPGDVANAEPFVNWISGGGNVEPLLVDHRTVIMTWVPGLAAKPVIDLMAVVGDLANLDLRARVTIMVLRVEQVALRSRDKWRNDITPGAR
jgi:hypothetical protein